VDNKKKKNGWSKPVIKGPKTKKTPVTIPYARPKPDLRERVPRRPPAPGTIPYAMPRTRDDQRRGVTETRRKAKAERSSEPAIKGRSGKKAVAKKAETQRRGMAETRSKAQAKRPTLSQKRAIQQRDKEMRQDAMMRSPAARRARDRMRAQF